MAHCRPAKQQLVQQCALCLLHGNRANRRRTADPLTTLTDCPALQQMRSCVHFLCRFMYGETLGRWRTADLLIGLAYLAKREGEGHPVADIAAQGRPIGEGASDEQRLVLLVSV